MLFVVGSPKKTRYIELVLSVYAMKSARIGHLTIVKIVELVATSTNLEEKSDSYHGTNA